LKNLVFTFLAFLVTTTVTGCSSISLQSSWKDPGTAPKQYRKLLVVGIANKPQMRQIFEEVYAAEVNKKGAAGIASYTLTGVANAVTRDAIVEAVKKSGADGVITTRMLSMKENKEVRTGFVLTDRGFTDVYGIPVSYAEFVHQPVEVTRSTQAVLETSLFDAGTGRLAWSATSNAVDPAGIITVSRELADSVIKALTRDGLL
jgi:hypothetical protein